MRPQRVVWMSTRCDVGTGCPAGSVSVLRTRHGGNAMKVAPGAPGSFGTFGTFPCPLTIDAMPIAHPTNVDTRFMTQILIVFGKHKPRSARLPLWTAFGEGR